MLCWANWAKLLMKVPWEDPERRPQGCSRREGMPSGTSDHQGEKARSIRGPSYSGAFSPCRGSVVGGARPFGGPAVHSSQNTAEPQLS